MAAKGFAAATDDGSNVADASACPLCEKPDVSASKAWNDGITTVSSRCRSGSRRHTPRTGIGTTAQPTRAGTRRCFGRTRRAAGQGSRGRWFRLDAKHREPAETRLSVLHSAGSRRRRTQRAVCAWRLAIFPVRSHGKRNGRPPAGGLQPGFLPAVMLYSLAGPRSPVGWRWPLVSEGGDDGALAGVGDGAQAGCLAPVLGRAPAAANPVKSLYTTVELKACKPVKRHRDGGAWLCDGLAGLPVYVAEGDLRQFLSVGENAQKRRAATQTLGAFNTDLRERQRPRDRRVALRSPRRPADPLRHHRTLPHLARGPQGRRAGGVEGERDRDLPRRLHRRAGQPGCHHACPFRGRQSGQGLRLPRRAARRGRDGPSPM